MAAPKIHRFVCVSSCCFLLATTSCSVRNSIEKSDIVIDNSVVECFKIEPIKKTIHNNLVLLDVKLDTIKSTGYCGCKSALLSYSVVESNSKGEKHSKSFSEFSSLLAGNYSFVLTRSYALNEPNLYTLHIQCGAAE